ncbi:ATP-binding cassette domain-containing protein [Paenibacillus sp. 481]|uniref:ATP-binding cassette domain-containing protein n=1 Tax=Paenibacillus sp. 481 TaxID=2835869 RepID=UPI001E61A918|nr:ATP-binding cassette domain-containing protein [Paenibacillus sp. 481]UHA73251.1 ATP-binding cassette domain-containing protein [Paenibacillus sp. 481]
MSDALRTSQLTKIYNDKEAVSAVSMNIKKGEIYGLLGLNGAGKTTIMRMITGLARPDGGTIEIFGESIATGVLEPLKRLGSMIEQPIFYDHLTAKANLEIHCEYMGFYDKEAIDEALLLVGLEGVGERCVQDFSLGMKQRLGIARAIVCRPEFLILDEPLNGLDPLGIRELRELLRKLNKESGMTILISSHILQVIEQLADTIGVMQRGKLIKEIPMAFIRSKLSEYIEVWTTDSKKATFVLEEKLHISNYKVMDDHTIRIYEARISAVELSKTLIGHEVGIEALSTKKMTLEAYVMMLLQGSELDA